MSAAASTEVDSLAWAMAETICLLAGISAERIAQTGSEPGWYRRRRAAELRAFHEAGHAIAYVVTGRHCYELSIVPDEGSRIGREGRPALRFSGGFCLRGELPELPQGYRREAGLCESDVYQAARIARWLGDTYPPTWKSTLRLFENTAGLRMRSSRLTG